MNVEGSKDAVRETSTTELRQQVQAEYRRYVVAVALLSLLVGGVIGRYALSDHASMARATLPPPQFRAAYVGPSTGLSDAVQPTRTPLPLRVYVSGAIASAQVVTVPSGSLVFAALSAAGGALPEADLDALNLAAPLHDHQHLHVPWRATSGLADGLRQGTALPVARIDINTASQAELETLPDIGPTRAQAIITYRESHGLFVNLADIQKVPGIGPTVYERIAPYITVSH